MEFKFIEFNDRRAMRGSPSARVEVDDGEAKFWIWMSRMDIKDNMKEYGSHPELIKALKAYV